MARACCDVRRVRSVKNSFARRLRAVSEAQKPSLLSTKYTVYSTPLPPREHSWVNPSTPSAGAATHLNLQAGAVAVRTRTIRLSDYDVSRSLSLSGCIIPPESKTSALTPSQSFPFSDEIHLDKRSLRLGSSQDLAKHAEARRISWPGKERSAPPWLQRYCPVGSAPPLRRYLNLRQTC